MQTLKKLGKKTSNFHTCRYFNNIKNNYKYLPMFVYKCQHFQVLVEQWSQNYELEQKCQQFFSRVEIFSRRNLDKDVILGSSEKCR